jgi:hypothetical protein
MSSIQRITSEYTVYIGQDLSLPRATEDYLEVVNISGLHLIHSLQIELNNQNVMIKVEIDGNTSFELDVNRLVYSGNLAGLFNPLFGFDTRDDIFFFKPRHSLLARNSFKVFMRANSNSGSRTMENLYLEYSEA